MTARLCRVFYWAGDIDMNTNQETLGMLGQPTPEMRDAIIKAQSIPNMDIAKSVASARNVNSAFAPAYGGMTQLSDTTLKALEAAGLGELAKSITTGTGLVAYDLQAPAKNLYPFYAPIRNFLPRVGGGVGTATNWRQVNAIIGSGFDNIAWVPEGQRSGRMTYNTSNKSASYVTIGEEDAITYEAINAARTFEDLQSTMVFRLLQKMMLKEEMALLGGNATLALAAPTAPTVSTAVVTGTALASATYYVSVVPLSIEGYNNAVRTAPMSAPTSISVTGADSQSYIVNGGSGPMSAISASQASGGNALTMTTPAVTGAVAYAWYIGTATVNNTTNRLQAITTTNSYVQSAALNALSQQASAMTADFSTNANYGFDGLLTTAFKTGSGAYINALATGTAGTGTVLTPSYRGSVAEIDTMFKTMWDTYQLSPTVIFVNSQELTNITTKCLQGGQSGSVAPLLRYDTPADGGDYRNFTAGGVISTYYNPYAPPDSGMMVPIRIHPKVPPGTIIGWAQNLPIQYQSNEVPNVAEVKTRQDYYQIDWPIVTRQRGVGVYAEEVLAVYAPFAMGVITNIANG
jgi:hypothetical protein